MGKGVVFTTILIAWSGFNPHPGHVVASLDKTLYDNFLCLVALNKQQIQWIRIRKNPQELWIIGNSKAGANSSNHKVVIAMKSARVVQYLASDAVWWQEDKYALQQQQQQQQQLHSLSYSRFRLFSGNG